MRKTVGLPVLCLFDNEEVGSQTNKAQRQRSFADTLERICAALGNGDKYREKVASGFLVSCDNAHVVHPNHPNMRTEITRFA